MRLALAVDSAGDYGSIALADETGVREEVPIHAPQGFSHVLFGEIESLLNRQRVTLKDIDVFAGASGPGSFTGVRVGLAAIKGLAEVMGKGVVAVSNLAAVAEYGTSDFRAVVIDARRGEIYGAVYDRAGNQIAAGIIQPSSWAAECFARLAGLLHDVSLIGQRSPLVFLGIKPVEGTLAGELCAG